MRESTITAVFSSDIQKVWDVVTDNENYDWRSDLSKIEIHDDNTFTEYTKDGFQTVFTIARKKPTELYAFDMENKNISGEWIGVFSETENGGTLIVFTEKIDIKNPIKRILSYFFMDLKKMQKTYITDLRKKLGELNGIQ